MLHSAEVVPESNPNPKKVTFDIQTSRNPGKCYTQRKWYPNPTQTPKKGLLKHKPLKPRKC
jgi:hypothetical protein